MRDSDKNRVPENEWLMVGQMYRSAKSINIYLADAIKRREKRKRRPSSAAAQSASSRRRNWGRKGDDDEAEEEEEEIGVKLFLSVPGIFQKKISYFQGDRSSLLHQTSFLRPSQSLFRSLSRSRYATYRFQHNLDDCFMDNQRFIMRFGSPHVCFKK